MTMPTLAISVEPCAPLIERELWPLLEQHREELTTNKAMMALAPDIARYAAMEDAGLFVGLIARIDGQIVGYSGNFIGPHLHYSALRYAHNDVLYVHPDHRAAVGLALIKATEDAMRERGAELMLWHAKPNTQLEKLLPLRRYRVQDVSFSKVL